MRRRVHGKAVLSLVERCLREGSTIEIDGVGSFGLDAENRVIFEAARGTRVFLAYAEEDRAQVRKLYNALKKAGFEPWMDQEKLLPGQNWPRAIERAIEVADFFLACFSRRSSMKRGHFQCELRYALDTASRVPLDDVFLVPLRLDDCEVPRHIANKTQWVDMFPDWNDGFDRLTSMMHSQMTQREKRREPGA